MRDHSPPPTVQRQLVILGRAIRNPSLHLPSHEYRRRGFEGGAAVGTATLSPWLKEENTTEMRQAGAEVQECQKHLEEERLTLNRFKAPAPSFIQKWRADLIPSTGDANLIWCETPSCCTSSVANDVGRRRRGLIWTPTSSTSRC